MRKYRMCSPLCRRFSCRDYLSPKRPQHVPQTPAQAAFADSGGAAFAHRGGQIVGHLPLHLPRIERVIETASTQCPCGCGEMARIGEDVSERLDVIPAQFRVLVTRRPK